MVKNGSKNAGKRFAERLLRWNREQNKREMPWKGEKDPYRIWLSEIILQQTRVDQGLKYYERFISTFPGIMALAVASEEKIFKLWEGLGYYSRCRNLIATAQTVANEYKGKFPDTYERIKALKGIGPYTAAAISSFAYNLPHAVVDGNVFRVLSRIFGIKKAIDSTEGKKYFNRLANELLDKKQPGLYNQAIMDFGAIVCKPVSPLCGNCVFNKSCYAFLHNKVNELPVKEKKLKTKERWFCYLVIVHKNRVAIRQRTTRDIWQQLYEFPLVETEQDPGQHVIITKAEEAGWLQKGTYEIQSLSPLYKQQLSHQLIRGRFITVKLKSKALLQEHWIWTSQNELTRYAFPRFINQYLEKTTPPALHKK